MKPGLARMRAATPAGHCLACGDLLPPREPGRPGGPRDICAAPECKRARHKLWQRDNPRPKVGITWFCGCGKRLCGKHVGHCLFQSARWPLVVIPAPRAP